MLNPLVTLLLWAAGLVVASAASAESPSEADVIVIDAASLGFVGDGVTDETPRVEELRRRLEAAARPVEVRFEANRVYRFARPPRGGHVFTLKNLRGVTIDGAGAEFRLGPEVRLLHAEGCQDLAVSGISVDFEPLPFVEATIVEVADGGNALVVAPEPGFRLDSLGGPTRTREEQTFFGMSWHRGPHGPVTQHQEIKAVEHSADGSTARIELVQPYASRAEDDPATPTRITLPVPRIAHLGRGRGDGLGEVVRVEGCTDVRLSDLRVWSAPWFAFGITGNRGTVTLNRCAVVPRPGSGRLTSAWRDAFHVKNNAAILRFNGCEADGCHDDTFNVASHGSQVVEVIDGRSVVVEQLFPLDITPIEAGNTLHFYDPATDRHLGEARVAAVAGALETVHRDGEAFAPRITVTFERTLPDLPASRTLVWNADFSNPDTVLTGCTLTNSLRLKSPVTIDRCDITAFIWITAWGEGIELPIPHGITIRDSTLRRGRGNPTHALMAMPRERMASSRSTAAGPPPVAGLTLEGNTIHGGLTFSEASGVRLLNNRLMPEAGGFTFADVRDVALIGNRVDDRPMEIGDLDLAYAADRPEVSLKP